MGLLSYQKTAGGPVVFRDHRDTTGNIFFVDSGASNAVDAAGAGVSPDKPFATLDYAIGQCTANNGDVIYVMPGHTETISAASGIDLDVAGVQVIGLGVGDSRPTITLNTATTATFVVGAADCVIQNLKFLSAIDSLAVMLDVDEGNFRCLDCKFVSSSTFEVLNFVNIATTKNNFFFKGCEFIQPTDPAGTDGNAATGGIYLVDSDYVYVEDCKFIGYFETACIHNKTTSTNFLWITNCIFQQLLSGAEILLLVAGATGGIKDSAGLTPNADDVTEAKVIGTIGDGFFVFNSTFGNDGAGGQNAVAGASAAT